MEDDLVAAWEIGTGGFKGAIWIAEPHAYLFDFVRPRRKAPLLEIVAFFVHPLRRGDGWGARLMARACAWADRQGADIALFVRPYGLRRTRAGAKVPKPNTDALIQFYTKYGFKSVWVDPGKITTDLEVGTVMLRRVK